MKNVNDATRDAVTSRTLRRERFNIGFEFDGAPDALPGCWLNCTHVTTVEVDRVDGRDDAAAVETQIVGVTLWTPAGVMLEGAKALVWINQLLPALLSELSRRFESRAVDAALGL